MFNKIVAGTVMALLTSVASAQVKTVRTEAVGGTTLITERIQNKNCASGYYESLTISGEYDDAKLPGAVRKSITALKRCQPNRVAVVFMDGPGGDLKIGIKLAVLFDEVQVSAVVPTNKQCWSSCAFAFIGATYRYMAKDSRVVFHMPYEIEKGRKVCRPDAEFENWLEDYFITTLGDEKGAYAFEKTTASCHGAWRLDQAMARAVGVVTSD